MKYQPATTIQDFIYNFIAESNAIEGIYRKATKEEIDATFKFIDLKEINVNDVISFVKSCQTDAVLRDKEGLDVYVGNHIPPAGSVYVKTRFEGIIKDANNGQDPFITHHQYETLHPFTDGNGRSGRIIWLWQMLKERKNLAPTGFLQTWYYQSLSEGRNDK